MPSYKLNYFNLRARGEITRLIFAAAEVPYTDNRIEFKDWPALKAQTPIGQVPYLEVDGKIINQSITIARFVARETKLYPTDSLEAAQSDAIVDTVNEVLNHVGKKVNLIAGPTPEQIVERMNDFFKNDAATFMINLEKLMGIYDAKSGFSVGSKLSWADLALFYVFDFMVKPTMVAPNPAMLDAYPLCKALHAKVAALPGIVKYLKERPSQVPI